MFPAVMPFSAMNSGVSSTKPRIPDLCAAVVTCSQEMLGQGLATHKERMAFCQAALHGAWGSMSEVCKSEISL